MRSLKGFFCLSLILLLVHQGPEFLFGEEKASDFGFSDSKEPINVQAKELEIFRREGKGIYKGDVVAKQGGSTLYSDTLTIFSDTEKGEIIRIIAKGHVKIVSEGRTATAGRVVFDNLARTVVLMENPVVVQDKDIISGSKITIFLDEQRSIVESEPGQKVNTTIFPKKETEKKKRKKSQ